MTTTTPPAIDAGAVLRALDLIAANKLSELWAPEVRATERAARVAYHHEALALAHAFVAAEQTEGASDDDHHPKL